MTDTYSIKFNHGISSFEVQGPSETWVDTKVNELKALMETLPGVEPTSETPKSTPPTPKKTVKKAATKSNSTQKTGDTKSQLEDKWTDELAAKILGYVAERQGGFDKGATKQAAILAVFLKDSESITTVTPQDMEIIYRKLSWPTINHEGQLRNAVARDKFFEKTTAGFELIHAGTVFGRDTSKTIAKDKK